MRPHYPYYGTGLSLKSMEARAGRHNSRGLDVGPRHRAALKEEAVNCYGPIAGRYCRSSAVVPDARFMV